MLHLSRLDTRGVSRSSRNVRRDAVDVKALTDERRPSRTAKSCGPGAPRSWRQVLAKLRSFAGDGGKRDGSPRRARISRKPLRGEGRSVSACTCGHARLRRFFCAAAPGAAATRPSLRPLFFGGRSHFKTRADYAARTRLHAHHREAQCDARPIARLRCFAGSPSSPPPAQATNWSGRTRIRRD
jgi:hypothetical protein